MRTDASYWHFRWTAGTKGGGTFRIPRLKGESRDEALLGFWYANHGDAEAVSRLAQLIDEPDQRWRMRRQEAKLLIRLIDIIDDMSRAFILGVHKAGCAWILRHDIAHRAALYYDCCRVLGADPATGRYEPESPT
jgi:hypothetical protein